MLYTPADDESDPKKSLIICEENEVWDGSSNEAPICSSASRGLVLDKGDSPIKLLKAIDTSKSYSLTGWFMY